ncbi:NUDIX hydrolase [Consotaella aegiceratis]|uniref:NUDIX hydrolase n=1 Tax=Consotaella aegiceratis TaxID=3097961 RepID=UPI002F40AB33
MDDRDQAKLAAAVTRVAGGLTPIDAMRREIEEELGVAPTECRFLEGLAIQHPERDVKVVCGVFAVLAWSGGEPTNASAEHATIGWFTPARIARLHPLADRNYSRLAAEAVALGRG